MHRNWVNVSSKIVTQLCDEDTAMKYSGEGGDLIGHFKSDGSCTMVSLISNCTKSFYCSKFASNSFDLMKNYFRQMTSLMRFPRVLTVMTHLLY